MWTELGQVFDRLSTASGVRAIVLTGAGDRAFTAGLDVSSSSIMSSDLPKDAARQATHWRRHIKHYQNCVSAVERCEKPGMRIPLALELRERVYTSKIAARVDRNSHARRNEKMPTELTDCSHRGPPRLRIRRRHRHRHRRRHPPGDPQHALLRPGSGDRSSRGRRHTIPITKSCRKPE